MSWSISVTGTPSAVKAEAAAALDNIAKSYEGKPEADDIAACKARALALIDALDFTDTGTFAPNAVILTAGGSHSTSAKGLYSANFKLDVQRTRLAL